MLHKKHDSESLVHPGPASSASQTRQAQGCPTAPGTPGPAPGSQGPSLAGRGPQALQPLRFCHQGPRVVGEGVNCHQPGPHRELPPPRPAPLPRVGKEGRGTYSKSGPLTAGRGLSDRAGLMLQNHRASPHALSTVHSAAPRSGHTARKPPQDPSPLRGTLGSSLRSPAEGEGHEGFPPPPVSA